MKIRECIVHTSGYDFVMENGEIVPYAENDNLTYEQACEYLKKVCERIASENIRI